jgi:hypothetical protein
MAPKSRMPKIELTMPDLGADLLAKFGLDGWKVIVVREEDDMGDEDDIAGRYGCCFLDDKLIWVNSRYADLPELVEDIIRHEITHALLQSTDHGPMFVEMARHIGLQMRDGVEIVPWPAAKR